ncbi:hypothetical protein [uncultured Tenacibaculum sp.]|uniref:hypothetical protein n=1 Tax=uncultured Tenacibaculum sp. TaxID=174713 RepID=UPI0026181F10|nr:hypothetical protein [uncultured Tenacibaculum sp.]
MTSNYIFDKEKLPIINQAIRDFEPENSATIHTRLNHIRVGDEAKIRLTLTADEKIIIDFVKFVNSYF